MNDDLPIAHEPDDTSFAAELGRTVAGFGFLSFFFAIVGVIAWMLIKA
jgi:hypothetical protein